MATHHSFLSFRKQISKQSENLPFHEKGDVNSAARLWNEYLKILWSGFFSSGIVVQLLEDSEIVELEA